MPNPTLADLEEQLEDLVRCAVAEEWQKTLVERTSGAERKYNLSMQNRAAGFKRQAHRKIKRLFQKISKKEND
jgi:hypothetical protein